MRREPNQSARELLLELSDLAGECLDLCGPSRTVTPSRQSGPQTTNPLSLADPTPSELLAQCQALAPHHRNVRFGSGLRDAPVSADRCLRRASGRRRDNLPPQERWRKPPLVAHSATCWWRPHVQVAEIKTFELLLNGQVRKSPRRREPTTCCNGPSEHFSAQGRRQIRPPPLCQAPTTCSSLGEHCNVPLDPLARPASARSKQSGKLEAKQVAVVKQGSCVIFNCSFRF